MASISNALTSASLAPARPAIPDNRQLFAEQTPVAKKDTKVEKNNTTTQESSAAKTSPEEAIEIKDLKQLDLSVRRHTTAHNSVGGQLTGGLNLTYLRGPNGVLYAIGGDVSFNNPRGGDLQTLLRQLGTLKAAAMAPTNPTSQDIGIAVQAGIRIQSVQTELQQSRQVEPPTAKANPTIDIQI